jgi:Flp pilus assembly protein TadG
MFHRTFKAQAMAEFALALPILLMVLIGVLEVSRMIFIYATVFTASREAVRFASAWGIDDSGYAHYQDCAAIRNAAKNVGFLLNLQDSNITISYDYGLDSNGNPIVSQTPNYPAIPNCTAASGAQTNINLNTGYRVTVTVNYNYSPMINFLPITSHSITSTVSRTIMGNVNLFTPTPPP